MAHSLMEKTHNECYYMTYIVSILVSEDPRDIKGVGKLAITSHFGDTDGNSISRWIQVGIETLSSPICGAEMKF